MRVLHSLLFRLALTYAVLFCLSVTVLGGLYFWVSVVRPTDAIKAQVDREARLVSQIYMLEGVQAARSALQALANRPEKRRSFHALILPNGAVASANLPSWPRHSTPGWKMLEADIYRDGDENDYAPLVRDLRFRDGARLIIGRDAEDVEELTEILSSAALWVLGGTLVLGLLGGITMSRAIGGRIDAVNRAARKVMEGDLSGRVPIRGSGDDFDQLGETLNRMLSRNEELFETVRRVSDNVAHELRTPLARLLAQLEQLQRIEVEEGSPKERSESLGQAVSEAQRLHRIFDALLRISRLESGRHVAGLRTVNLSDLLADAAEFHQPEASRKGITLSVEAPAELCATVDPDLVFQAISNLLDNAFKYGTAGGKVELSAVRGDDRIILSVRDDGPGLPADERQRITERFFRGSDAVGLPGEGLGLSVVAAIAKQHGAVLSIEDNRPGLAVALAFSCLVRDPA
jgi:signal transduction histidine kinase